jgi:hypothetical protein
MTASQRLSVSPGQRIRVLASSSRSTSRRCMKFGANNRDQNAATARAFEHTHVLTHPSAMGAESSTMTLAFSAFVGPNAVPTTLVINKQGRVSARVLGRSCDTSVLGVLIETSFKGERSMTTSHRCGRLRRPHTIQESLSSR